MRSCPVLVPMPAERPYTYAVPDGMDVGRARSCGCRSDRARSPASCGTARRTVDPKKLKPISEVFDCPPLDDDMRRFSTGCRPIRFAARMVARMVLRAPAAFDPEPLAGLRFTGAGRTG